jgi:hypothetical protein
MNQKPIPIFRLRYNADTGQWEHHTLDGFYRLPADLMRKMYRQSVKDMEQLRWQVIEQALEKSNMSAAQDIINRIREK